jgi:hypothetical protein
MRVGIVEPECSVFSTNFFSVLSKVASIALETIETKAE